MGVRLRNGLLGLLATVAIVATAAAWQGGEERGPLSLLSIELGRHGAPDVVESPYDVRTVSQQKYKASRWCEAP